MTNYYTRKTPDYSPLLVHFTKDGARRMVRQDDIPADHPLHQYKEQGAIEKLASILTTRTIHASPMPFLGEASAVCFTECVWDALLAHRNRYSSYGVVFSKGTIFQAGGGPALYIRGDILRNEIGNLPQALKAFVVPFDPDAVLQEGVIQDWIHEREWRVPTSFRFEYADVKYILVESIADADRIRQLVETTNLSADRFIPMEVYDNIRTAWGA